MVIYQRSGFASTRDLDLVINHLVRNFCYQTTEQAKGIKKSVVVRAYGQNLFTGSGEQTTWSTPGVMCFIVIDKRKQPDSM